MRLLILFCSVVGSLLLALTIRSHLDSGTLQSVSRWLRGRLSVGRDFIFRKQITVRLTDDESGFCYSVNYGCRLLPRRILPHEDGEVTFGIETWASDPEDREP